MFGKWPRLESCHVAIGFRSRQRDTTCQVWKVAMFGKSPHHLLEDAEENVCVEGPLVRLVHDDGRVPAKLARSSMMMAEYLPNWDGRP